MTAVEQMSTYPHPESIPRVSAFRLAGQLFRDCYLEANPDDLIAVADWLLTGTADPAIAFSDQRARNYGQRTEENADAARWTGEPT